MGASRLRIASIVKPACNDIAHTSHKDALDTNFLQCKLPVVTIFLAGTRLPGIRLTQLERENLKMQAHHSNKSTGADEASKSLMILNAKKRHV